MFLYYTAIVTSFDMVKIAVTIGVTKDRDCCISYFGGYLDRSESSAVAIQ